MSGSCDEVGKMSRAKLIEQRAANWIERRDFGGWTKFDTAALEAWLEESLDHQVAFYRLEFSWERTARLSALRAADPARRSQQNRSDWFGRVGLIAAAIGVAAFCAGASYQFFRSPTTEAYATAVGGRRLLTLPDSSQIELNTDTAIKVATGGGERKVWLSKGEAFFEIKHDAAHPFVVLVGEQRITDLGTKFLVRRQADNQVAISVIEGRARVETGGPPSQSQSAELVPGDFALASENSLSVSHGQALKLESELGWRRGVLIFHETTLAAAAAEFNRYNSERLTIADLAVAQMTIDGTFPANRLGTFARVARDVLGLRVEDRGGEFVISR